MKRPVLFTETWRTCWWSHSCGSFTAIAAAVCQLLLSTIQLPVSAVYSHHCHGRLLPKLTVAKCFMYLSQLNPTVNRASLREELIAYRALSWLFEVEKSCNDVSVTDGPHIRRWSHNIIILYYNTYHCGPGSSAGIATDYGLDGPGIESRCGQDFPPVQISCGAHPASCKKVTRSFQGVEAAGACCWPLTPLYCRGHGRVELYLYPPNGPHRACNGKTLPLYIYIYIYIYIYMYKVIKKIDSISYVYISWTIHGILWMMYITCEKGSPQCLNTIARTLD